MAYREIGLKKSVYIVCHILKNESYYGNDMEERTTTVPFHLITVVQFS